MNEIFSQPLETLYDQDDYIVSQLNNAGITTIGQLVACSKRELAMCDINNAGIFKDLDMVRKKLEEHNLFLDGEEPKSVKEKLKTNQAYGKYFAEDKFIDSQIFNTLIKYNIETYGDLQEYDSNGILHLLIKDDNSFESSAELFSKVKSKKI